MSAADVNFNFSAVHSDMAGALMSYNATTYAAEIELSSAQRKANPFCFFSSYVKVDVTGNCNEEGQNTVCMVK